MIFGSIYQYLADIYQKLTKFFQDLSRRFRTPWMGLVTKFVDEETDMLTKLGSTGLDTAGAVEIDVSYLHYQ